MRICALLITSYWVFFYFASHHSFYISKLAFNEFFGHTVDTIKCTYLSTTQIYGILHQWYTLWQELGNFNLLDNDTHAGILITDCPRHCHHKTNVSQKSSNNGYRLPLKNTLQFLRTCRKIPR